MPCDTHGSILAPGGHQETPDEPVYLKASSPDHSGAGETIARCLDPRGF